MTRPKNVTFRLLQPSLLAALLCALAAPALAAPSDAWITTKVKLALLTTEDVSATVSVDTVNRQVTLHGKVRSDAEKQKTETVAKGIDGVLGVRNLLQVVPAQQETAVQQSDDDIKKNVDKALKADNSLKDSSISVQSVNKGVVLLGGTAKTLTDHLNAVEVASGVKGVRRVASEVQSPDKLAEMERGVKKGFEDHADLSDVGIEVKNCVARLTGTVSTGIERLEAMQIARATHGVCSVQDDIHLAD